MELLTYRLFFLLPAVVLARLPRLLGAPTGNEQARSDLHRIPGEPANRFLLGVLRAEDRLIVCGHETKNTPPDDCWYDIVRRGLAEAAEPVEFNLPASGEEAWSGLGLRL